ncbi:MAG: hypothetical protein ACYC6X_03050 [Minisyncoccota bacterium]
MNTKGINSVFVCPNLEIRNALIRAISEAGKVRPAMKSDSVSARRAHYASALSKTIINVSSGEMQLVIGPHSSVIAIETANRVDAANCAKKVFNDAGFEATVHTQAEPEFPEGFIVFVAVPALKGIALMFWPRPEDVTPEIGHDLPKRVEWTDADFNTV